VRIFRTTHIRTGNDIDIDIDMPAGRTTSRKPPVLGGSEAAFAGHRLGMIDRL
jgi:hypothetical protein